MTVSWEETILPTILSNIDCVTSIKQMALACDLKLCSFKDNVAQVENIARKNNKKITGMTVSNALERSIPIFRTGKSAKPRCLSSMYEISSVNMEPQKKLMERFLKMATWPRSQVWKTKQKNFHDSK